MCFSFFQSQLQIELTQNMHFSSTLVVGINFWHTNTALIEWHVCFFIKRIIDFGAWKNTEKTSLIAIRETQRRFFFNSISSGVPLFWKWEIKIERASRTTHSAALFQIQNKVYKLLLHWCDSVWFSFCCDFGPLSERRRSVAAAHNKRSRL